MRLEFIFSFVCVSSQRLDELEVESSVDAFGLVLNPNFLLFLFRHFLHHVRFQDDLFLTGFWGSQANIHLEFRHEFV